MSLKSKYKQNAILARDGVWFEKGTNADGTVTRFLVRRSGRGNPDWNRVFAKHTEELGDEPSTEDDNRSMGATFGEACVLGWEHLQPDDDGAELPYSTEAAVAFFSNPDWLDLLTEMQNDARGLEGFRDKREDEAKN